MNSHRIISAFLLIAALQTATAFADTVRENFSRTVALAAGASVVLSNENGSVEVTTWDRPEVRIVAEKRVQARQENVAAKAMKNLRIDVSSTPSELKIETKAPRGDDSIFHWIAGSTFDTMVNYVLTVPRNLVLSIETVNGRVHITGVGGSLKLETVNGSIDIENASGSLEASTVNGQIRAEMRQLNGKPLKIGTVNGSITLALPSTLKAQLDAGTTNGEIDVDFPITLQKKAKAHLKGAINGGGPELRLRTTNGSITVRRGA